MSALRTWMLVGIAVFPVELLELIPRRLLVGEVDAPLDIDEFPRVSPALDGVAELERATFRARLIVDEHLESGGLPHDPTLAVLEAVDAQHRLAVGREPRIPLPIAGDRQGPGFSGAMENWSGPLPRRAIPIPGVDPVNEAWWAHIVFEYTGQNAAARFQSRKIRETPSRRRRSLSSW